jgi:hypothetical protein
VKDVFDCQSSYLPHKANSSILPFLHTHIHTYLHAYKLYVYCYFVLSSHCFSLCYSKVSTGRKYVVINLRSSSDHDYYYNFSVIHVWFFLSFSLLLLLAESDTYTITCRLYINVRLTYAHRWCRCDYINLDVVLFG